MMKKNVVHCSLTFVIPGEHVGAFTISAGFSALKTRLLSAQQGSFYSGRPHRHHAHRPPIIKLQTMMHELCPTAPFCAYLLFLDID